MQERHLSKYQGVYRRQILNLQNWDVRMWIGFNWLRIASAGGIL
jgi:hypothetical protein